MLIRDDVADSNKEQRAVNKFRLPVRNGRGLAPILPATLKPYDLKPAAGPQFLRGVGSLAGLKLPADAATVLMHQLALKPGAQVALTAGGQPALILGEAGKGRAVLLARAPLGDDVRRAWWRSETGEKVTEAACRWLLRMP